MGLYYEVFYDHEVYLLPSRSMLKKSFEGMIVSLRGAPDLKGIVVVLFFLYKLSKIIELVFHPFFS